MAELANLLNRIMSDAPGWEHSSILPLQRRAAPAPAVIGTDESGVAHEFHEPAVALGVPDVVTAPVRSLINSADVLEHGQIPNVEDYMPFLIGSSLRTLAGGSRAARSVMISSGAKPPPGSGVSRRTFLKGTAATVAAAATKKPTGLLNALTAPVEAAASGVHPSVIDLWNVMKETDPGADWAAMPETLGEIHHFHSNALKTAVSPSEIAAHQEVLDKIKDLHDFHANTADDVEFGQGDEFGKLTEDSVKRVNDIESASRRASTIMPPGAVEKALPEQPGETNVQRILRKIEYTPSQEDIFEYSPAELERMYGLTADEAKELYNILETPSQTWTDNLRASDARQGAASDNAWQKAGYVRDEDGFWHPPDQSPNITPGSIANEHRLDVETAERQGAQEGGAYQPSPAVKAYQSVAPTVNPATLAREHDADVSQIFNDALKAQVHKLGVKDPVVLAYHGSPHKFDAFDINKIGTGEGAQTYGHGLYFAENEKTALDYYNKFKRSVPEQHEFAAGPDENLTNWQPLHDLLGRPHYSGDHRTINDIQNAIEGIDPGSHDEWGAYSPNHQSRVHIDDILDVLHGALKHLADTAKKNPNRDPKFLMAHDTEDPEQFRAALNAAVELQKLKDAGHNFVGHRLATPDASMYHVAINAHPNTFLDFDKPYSEQSDIVKQIPEWSHLSEGETGSDLHDYLTGDLEEDQLLFKGKSATDAFPGSFQTRIGPSGRTKTPLEYTPEELAYRHIMNIPRFQVNPAGSPNFNTVFNELRRSADIEGDANYQAAHDWLKANEHHFTVKPSVHMEPEEFAKRLKALGVNGIKYLDQGSRGLEPQLHYNDIPAKQSFPQSYAKHQTIFDLSPEELAVQYVHDTNDDPSEPFKVAYAIDELEADLQATKKTGAAPISSQVSKTDSRERADEIHEKYRAALEWLEAHKDRFSRRTPPQTHNYVVFDPRHIEIMRRYAIPAAVGATGLLNSQQSKADTLTNPEDIKKLWRPLQDELDKLALTPENAPQVRRLMQRMDSLQKLYPDVQLSVQGDRDREHAARWLENFKDQSKDALKGLLNSKDKN